jgi:hypothetical protein
VTEKRSLILHEQNVSALDYQQKQQEKRHQGEIQIAQQTIELQDKTTTAEQDALRKRVALDEELKGTQSENARKRKEADSEVEVKVLRAKEEAAGDIEAAAITRSLDFKGKLNLLELALIKAGAEADVLRLDAVQPGLIEAIEGLGDKQAITELMQNMPAATGEIGYLLGSGGIAGLLKMLEGTPFADSLKSLKAKTTPKLKKATE